MRKTITLLIAMALLSAGAAAKEGYYRWLDDSGQPHFTQKPPHDRPSQFVETKTGYSSDGQNDSAPEQATADEQSAPQTRPKGQEQFEVLPAKSPERCNQAKNALESFSRGGLIRAKDPETGETRVLDNAEREQQKERAREMVEIYCE